MDMAENCSPHIAAIETDENDNKNVHIKKCDTGGDTPQGNDDVASEKGDDGGAIATNGVAVETDAEGKDDIAALLEGSVPGSSGGDRVEGMRTRRRSWKKRVAEYVSNLPSVDKYDELGILSPVEDIPEKKEVTDPKRQKLELGDSAQATKLKSAKMVSAAIPQREHQPLKEKQSMESVGSSYLTSSLATTSSDERAVHPWLISMDPSDVGKTDLSSSTTPVAMAKEKKGAKLMRGGSFEDDLSLGAEALYLQPVSNGASATSKSPKETQELRKGDVCDPSPERQASGMEKKSDKRNLLQLMAEKQCSMTSDLSEMTTATTISSVDELLQARNDPEELLMSLGFGVVVETEKTSRIPDRFLQSPSSAKGINVKEFLEYENQKVENRAAAVGGYLGIEGTGVFRKGGASVVNKVATMSSIINMLKRNVAQSPEHKKAGLAEMFAKPATPKTEEKKTIDESANPATSSDVSKQSKVAVRSLFSPKSPGFKSLVSKARKNEAKSNVGKDAGASSPPDVTMETKAQGDLKQKVVEQERGAEIGIGKAAEKRSEVSSKPVKEEVSSKDKVSEPMAVSVSDSHVTCVADRNGLAETDDSMSGNKLEIESALVENFDEVEEEKGVLERTLTEEDVKEEMKQNQSQENLVSVDTQDSHVTMETGAFATMATEAIDSSSSPESSSLIQSATVVSAAHVTGSAAMATVDCDFAVSCAKVLEPVATNAEGNRCPSETAGQIDIVTADANISETSPMDTKHSCADLVLSKQGNSAVPGNRVSQADRICDSEEEIVAVETSVLKNAAKSSGEVVTRRLDSQTGGVCSNLPGRQGTEVMSLGANDTADVEVACSDNRVFTFEGVDTLGNKTLPDMGVEVADPGKMQSFHEEVCEPQSVATLKLETSTAEREIRSDVDVGDISSAEGTVKPNNRDELSLKPSTKDDFLTDTSNVYQDKPNCENLDTTSDKIFSAIKTVDRIDSNRSEGREEPTCLTLTEKEYLQEKISELSSEKLLLPGVRSDCAMAFGSECVRCDEVKLDRFHGELRPSYNDDEVDDILDEEGEFLNADMDDAKDLLEKVQKHVQAASEKFQVQKVNVTRYAAQVSPSRGPPGRTGKPGALGVQSGDDDARRIEKGRNQDEVSGNEDKLRNTKLPAQSSTCEEEKSFMKREFRKPLQVPQESFEIEEISSTDHNVEEFPLQSAAGASNGSHRNSSHSTLMRMGSSHSDSSGFADDTHIDHSLIQTTDPAPSLVKLDAVDSTSDSIDVNRLHARDLQQQKKSSTESSASDVTIATECERKLSSAPSVGTLDDARDNALEPELSELSQEANGQEVTTLDVSEMKELFGAQTAVRVSLTEPRAAEEVENFLDTLQKTIEDVTGADHIVCKKKQPRRVRTEKYLYRSRSQSTGGDVSSMRDVSKEGEETAVKAQHKKPPLRRTSSATVMIENGRPKTQVRRRGMLQKAHSVDEERDRDREGIQSFLETSDTSGKIQVKSAGDEIERISESPLESSKDRDDITSSARSGGERIDAESATDAAKTDKQTRETQTESPDRRNSTMLPSPDVTSPKRSNLGMLDISPILQTSTSDTGRSVSDSSFIGGKKINIGTESVTSGRRSPEPDCEVLSMSAHSLASEDGSLIDRVARLSSPAAGLSQRLRRTPSWAEEANLETHPASLTASPHDVFFDCVSARSGSFLKVLPRGSALDEEDVFSLPEEEFVRVMRGGREVWMSKAEYGRLRDELLLKALMQQPNPLYGGHKVGLQLPPMIFREEPTSWDTLTATESAMKEVRYLQQGVLKYKADLIALETLSAQQFQVVYDHLTEEERDDWEGLKTLRLQIIEEIYEMERLLSSRAKTINEVKQRSFSLDDDTSMSEHSLQSLDMIKQMIDLLKEQINQRGLLHNIQMHSALSSHHSGISSPISEYSLDSSVPRMVERDEVLQELLAMKKELEWQRYMDKKERERSIREMKTVIVEEVTYNITKETTQKLKMDLEAKDEELRKLRRQLDEYNSRQSPFPADVKREIILEEEEDGTSGEVT